MTNTVNSNSKEKCHPAIGWHIFLSLKQPIHCKDTKNPQNFKGSGDFLA